MSPLTGDLGVADLAVLERSADPNALVELGHKRLTALIAIASSNHQGVERARQWLDAAEASLELCADHPAAASAGLAAEVATEVRLLRATQTDLAAHASEREDCYRWVDTGALARSLPGLTEVGGPALVACMGDPSRFRRGKRSGPSPAWSPKRPRPGKPTARASPCPKPARRCCAPPWCAPPTTPANSIRSSPTSTTSRWSNVARTTSAPSASPSPTSPNGHAPSCTAACPT